MCVAQVNESTWIAWEIWYHTDWPTDRPLTPGGYPVSPIADWRAGGLDGEVDWSTAPVKGHFAEVHSQLTHLHSYQIADLFNLQNITRRYAAFQYERLTG